MTFRDPNSTARGKVGAARQSRHIAARWGVNRDSHLRESCPGARMSQRCIAAKARRGTACETRGSRAQHMTARNRHASESAHGRRTRAPRARVAGGRALCDPQSAGGRLRVGGQGKLTVPVPAALHCNVNPPSCCERRCCTHKHT